MCIFTNVNKYNILYWISENCLIVPGRRLKKIVKEIFQDLKNGIMVNFNNKNVK